MFLKAVLCHWATAWNALNRKSVVASAVRPQFGIFVSVSRGDEERGKEQKETDKERAGVCMSFSLNSLCQRANVWMRNCKWRLYQLEFWALNKIKKLNKATKKDTIFSYGSQLPTITHSHENLLSAASFIPPSVDCFTSAQSKGPRSVRRQTDNKRTTEVKESKEMENKAQHAVLLTTSQTYNTHTHRGLHLQHYMRQTLLLVFHMRKYSCKQSVNKVLVRLH